MAKPVISTGYRPMPRDFPDAFARVGWEGIEDEMRSHKRAILRWCEEYGYDRLKIMRREYLEAHYAKRGHRIPGRRPTSTAGRYVMGLRRKIVWPSRQPRFWDFDLLTAERLDRPSVKAQMLASAAPIVDVDQPMLPGVE
jgi:hypothetical protein